METSEQNLPETNMTPILPENSTLPQRIPSPTSGETDLDREADRHSHADVEAPEQTSAANIEIGLRSSPAEEPLVKNHAISGKFYTVEDIQGDRMEVMAEGDVIESIEESSNYLKGSARSILLPELTDDQGKEFENIPSPPMSPREKRPAPILGLRDLTAQLMVANANRDSERKGLDGATRGTAADRMAETAAILFSSRGSLPDGVPLDSNGQPQNTSEQVQTDTKRNLRKHFRATRDHIKENKDLFLDFVRPRKKFIWRFWWIRFKFLIFPGLCIAALLFYACGNPPHGKLTKINGTYVDEEFGTVPQTASVSWWILFIAVRQIITLGSAEMWELFLVDFLAFKTRILTSILGPYVSLWIAQSKGWPFRAIAWGITNIIFLAGPRDFVNHWGYFQDWIGLFNGRNPSGNVLTNQFYHSLIFCCIGFGGATVAKRAILSNVVGKRLVGKCPKSGLSSQE